MNTLKYILYADDDDDDLQFFSEVLAEFPEYDLLTFSSGVELIAYIDSAVYRGDIHFIVSDINMPPLSGLQTLRHLKTRGYSRDIPVCLYSTSINPMDKAVAAAMDTKIYLKAQTFSGLKEVVGTMLKECCGPVQHSSSSSMSQGTQ